MTVGPTELVVEGTDPPPNDPELRRRVVLSALVASAMLAVPVLFLRSALPELGWLPPFVVLAGVMGFGVSFRRGLDARRRLAGRVRVRVDASGVRLEARGLRSSLAWRAISSVERARWHVHLAQGPATGTRIPLAWFASPEEADRFVERARSWKAAGADAAGPGIPALAAPAGEVTYPWDLEVQRAALLRRTKPAKDLATAAAAAFALSAPLGVPFALFVGDHGLILPMIGCSLMGVGVVVAQRRATRVAEAHLAWVAVLLDGAPVTIAWGPHGVRTSSRAGDTTWSWSRIAAVELRLRTVDLALPGAFVMIPRTALADPAAVVAELRRAKAAASGVEPLP